MLWKFNRFLPEKPCQMGTLAKRLLLMLIDVGLPAICVILPPAPSVLQEDSSDDCVFTRGSVRRASGFVLTGHSEVILFDTKRALAKCEAGHAAVLAGLT
jgi:hypothetical protein